MLTQKRTFRHAKQIAVATFVIVVIAGISISLVRCGNDVSTENSTIEELTNNPIYVTVDQSATFQNGDVNSFRNYIMTNLKYPDAAKEIKAEGRVIVQFVVEKDGKVEQIKTLRSSGNIDLDNEAVRALSNSPKWVPAKLDNINVAQVFVIPVVFKL